MNNPVSDPVLAAIKDARDRKDQADHELRILLAYARELTSPRPYRLTDLAAVARMSISGIRTAYTCEDIEIARQRWGGNHPDGTAPSVTAINSTSITGSGL